MSETSHRQQIDLSGDSAPHQADATSYAPISARAVISELEALLAIADRQDPGFPEERLEELGLVCEGGDPPEEQADRLIEGKPWAVQATVTFEVVLAPHAPDRRLCLECDVDLLDPSEPRRFPGRGGYTVRRASYRYSWSGSSEVELSGAARQVAERFAARVVPELAS